MSPLNEVLENNIEILLNSAKAVDKMPHQGLKGTAREEYLEEFLQKYLPHQWGIGRGQIEDSLGGVSNESDLIIYDRNSLPPTLIGKSINIFPIESVKYVFEVKSTIRSGEIKDTVKKFNTLKSLYIKNEKRPVRVLFGFQSDLTEKSELERIQENDDDFNIDPAIQIAVIVGRGYWIRASRVYEVKEHEKKVTTNVFYRLNPSPDRVEIKSFLFALLNTLNPELPSFSNYFKMSSDIDGTFHEELELFVKEEPIIDVEYEDINNLSIKTSLIIHHKSKPKKKFYDILRFKKNITNDLSSKYHFQSDSNSIKYEIPQCKIELINDSDDEISIKSCDILTSKGLKFFINSSSNVIKFPLTIGSKSTVILKSEFLCFKKNKESKSIGGSVTVRRGDIYGNHNYKFENKMMNIACGVVQLTTINDRVKYSDEFHLSEFILVDNNKELDFILEYTVLARLFSGDRDFIKEISTNHNRSKKK